MRLLHVTLFATFAIPAFAADVPKPDPTDGDEPLAKAFSAAKAAEYLDGVGVNWTRDRKCITCHTNMPYLLARPFLPGDAGWKEVRGFLEKDVASWSSGGKPRGEAYVVLTAFALTFHDANHGGTLSPAARAALDRMWQGQKPTGEWNWIKCNWPPMEHDDYYGATVAALAVGLAPEGYANTDAAKAGVEKLRAYFKKTPSPDLHHTAMLLWASTKLDGLMTADEKAKAVAALRAKQRADGGWSLPSLGAYKRRDKTDNDPAAPSDGYATGLAVYVLRQAGVPADDPAAARGAAWLRANQRASGRWYTRSLNNDKDHYITNAGTAFAVLALQVCGEKIEAR
jgi:squalene-hopene/tetraprenyl-beta-curcumene cyclase